MYYEESGREANGENWWNVAWMATCWMKIGVHRAVEKDCWQNRM